MAPARRAGGAYGRPDLVCTQERILKIFKITGLTKVFGTHQSVDQAIAART